MNLRRFTARTAVAGVTTALAAGALMGVTSTAANAEAASATYNCAVAGQSMPVSVSVGSDQLALLPPLPAGFAAPAEQLPVDVTVTLPEAVVSTLKTYGVTAIGLKDTVMKLPFGNSAVPLSGVTAPQTAVPDSGDMVIDMAATNGAFKLPTIAGAQAVKLPKSFTTTADTSLAPLGMECTIDGAQPTIASLTVNKQASALAVAKKTVTIKKGKTAKVAVKVSGDNFAPTGKVTAKEGKKTRGTASLKKGKATISIKKLTPGKHKITVSYAGDKGTNKSNTAKVTVVVKK